MPVCWQTQLCLCTLSPPPTQIRFLKVAPKFLQDVSDLARAKRQTKESFLKTPEILLHLVQILNQIVHGPSHNENKMNLEIQPIQYSLQNQTQFYNLYYKEGCVEVAFYVTL